MSQGAPPNYPMTQYPSQGKPDPYSQPYPQYAPPGSHPPPPSTTTVIVQPAAGYNVDTFIILSCVVYWCCNCMFGAIAFALAMSARSSLDQGDIEGAKSRGKSSMWVSVAGIIISVIVGVLILILYFTGMVTFYFYY